MSKTFATATLVFVLSLSPSHSVVVTSTPGEDNPSWGAGVLLSVDDAPRSADAGEQRRSVTHLTRRESHQHVRDVLMKDDSQSISMGTDGAASGDHVPAFANVEDHKVDHTSVKSFHGVKTSSDDEEKAGIRALADVRSPSTPDSMAMLWKKLFAAFWRSTVDFLRYVVDESKNMDRPQFTMIFVISCLALTILIALIPAWSPKVQTGSRWSLHLRKEFDPSEKTMGSTASLAMFSFRPEDCPHDGARTHTSRGQTFSVCSHCGSRWMLSKTTNDFVPVSLKSMPTGIS